MSGYRFFLSYTRKDNDIFLQKFFKDLTDQVAARGGVTNVAEAGFLDTTSLKHGDEWPPALFEALQTSAVCVALYSPRYFLSEFCGKEWQIFRGRRDLYVRTNPNAPRPRIILPVMWWPVPDDSFEALPEHVRRVQLSDSGIGADFMREGLHEIKRKWPKRYREVVAILAKTIVDNSAFALPPVPGKGVNDFPSAFQSAAAAQTVGTNTTVVAPGNPPPDAVCVIVAARRAEFNGVPINVDAYGLQGGPDWRPFLPDARDAGFLAQDAADAEHLQLEITTPEPDLVQRLEQAWDNNVAAIMLVDRWTLQIQRYYDHVASFDRRLLPNTVVVVPWNAAENPPPVRRALLETLVQQAFPRHSLYPDPNTFVDTVSTPDELRTAIQLALRNARSLLITRGRPRRPIPQSGPPPVLSASPA